MNPTKSRIDLFDDLTKEEREAAQAQIAAQWAKYEKEHPATSPEPVDERSPLVIRRKKKHRPKRTGPDFPVKSECCSIL